MLFMIKSYLCDESSLIWRCDRTFLIQKIKNAQFLIINELDHFDIVFEINLPELMLELL